MAKKDKKPAAPPADPQVIESNPFEQSRTRGPIIWALLLFTPIAAGIIISLFQPAPVQQAAVVAQEDAAPPAPITHALRDRPTDKEWGCDFSRGWVGQKINQTTMARINQLRRPYRIVTPGGIITQDHSPARVNFDVDDDEKITRVWCG
jgi:hypothetical protein